MSSRISRLKGKTALVTGAAVGLGRAYAEALAEAGANLAMTDARDEVSRLPDQLIRFQIDTQVWQGDVADPNHVRKVVDEAYAHFGSIDVLVNNAGVWGASVADDTLDKSLEDYDHIVGTNLKGEYLFGRAVIPIMIEQVTSGRADGGEIVNIATDHMVTCGTPWNVCPHLDACPWADAPRPTGGGEAMDLYDAAKWGLNGLLYGWAKALAPYRIRVNQFCMGATDSYMLRSFHNFKPSDEEVASWMKAEDNAAALVALLEEGPTGRNAQNMNFCVGRPVKLEPPHDHIYIKPEQIRIGASS